VGREADLNEMALTAAAERLMGPVREPKARDETGCEKCGAPKQAFVKRWCHGPIHLSGQRQQCRQEGEHLHCACQACGYVWLERCLDWVEPSPLASE